MNVLTVMISIMGVIVDQDKIRTHQVLTFEARSRFVSTFSFLQYNARYTLCRLRHKGDVHG